MYLFYENRLLNFWKRDTFVLAKNSPNWWRREYYGAISPFNDHKFRLICDTLTGRQNVKRPSPTVTHRIFGGWIDPEGKEVQVINFYCEKLSAGDAIALHDVYRKWWVETLKRYGDLKRIRGISGRLP